MGKLEKAQDRAMELIGEIGDGLRSKVPDKAVRWVETGAALGALRAGSKVAGGFVRRVARTHHYDGVISGGTEPAEVAVFGMGPINYRPSDPNGKQGYMRA